jgi:hypothetical protein
MNRDSHQIYETYKTTSANQEIIQEGLFDRLKARGAQAVGAVKGLGQQAAGTVKGAVAGVKGDVAGVKAAQKQKMAGQMSGELAKYQSIIKSAVSGTVNDLKKLKMPIKDETALNKALTDAILGQLVQATATGQLRQAGTGKIGAKIA